MGPLLLLLAACGGKPAIDLILLCNSSGPFDKVCNNELRMRLAAEWSAEAVHAPGSRLDMLLVGGSYADVRTVSFQVGRSWDGAVGPAKIRFRRDVIAEVHDLNLLSDDQVGRWVKRSDDFSALALADAVGDRTREGAQKPELIFASDGMQIGEGFNFERDGIPDLNRALAKLGPGWSLDGFSSVIICGFTNEGLKKSVADARDAFFKGLFPASGGPAPTIVPSCAELFAPVPLVLLPAKAMRPGAP